MNFSKNMTQRTELFFLHMPQRIEPLKNMTQRMEPFSQKKIDSKNWTSFSNMTQRIELFLSYNWEICLKELNFSKKRCLEDFSEKYHSNFRTFFWMTQRIEFLSTWLTELKQFFHFKVITELSPSFQHDSQNWTFFL